jgi:hypothetical protein
MPRRTVMHSATLAKKLNLRIVEFSGEGIPWIFSCGSAALSDRFEEARTQRHHARGGSSSQWFARRWPTVSTTRMLPGVPAHTGRVRTNVSHHVRVPMMIVAVLAVLCGRAVLGFMASELRTNTPIARGSSISASSSAIRSTLITVT